VCYVRTTGCGEHGQTVLEKSDMFVEHTDQRLALKPAHPDQPVSKVQSRVMLYMGMTVGRWR